MKVTLLGASGGEVTGSSYLLETSRARVLIDCGLFQGAQRLENYNRLPSRDRVGQLDAVVLTHAHLDHTGRLPLLTRFGYSRAIHATPATIALTSLILKDAARLQAEDAKRQNRWRVKAGKSALEPLFSASQVERLAPLFRRLPYERSTEVAPGVAVRAVEAGHVLGSASLELAVDDNGRKQVVVFSGDLGPRGAPLHRDPVPFQYADVVFMEATYGDRDHKSLQETAIEAREAIRATVEGGGRVLVPTFAIGRTQLLLLLLAGAFKRKTLKPFPIFIDSPMAIEATEIYRKHSELFDEEAQEMMRSGELAAARRMLTMLRTAAESRTLATKSGPFLVMAGAGMCTGGRIMHHLANHLADATTLVLVVGFQGHGSLGRSLVDGAKSVKIFGQKVDVAASVHTLGGLSGHAGQKDLLSWIGTLAPSKPRIILTHGEDKAREALGSLIGGRYGLSAELPGYRDVVEF
jgi:metallo-beta-lactamase family protein